MLGTRDTPVKDKRDGLCLYGLKSLLMVMTGTLSLKFIVKPFATSFQSSARF